MQCSVWQEKDSRVEQNMLERPLQLGQVKKGRRAKNPVLIKIAPTTGAVAALVVPKKCLIPVTRNGLHLGSGVHPLRHADEVRVGNMRSWVALQASMETTAYDPAQHGENSFCFITKARLQPGQAIAICPGTPEKACCTIYKLEAWNLAQQLPTPFRCAQCGFKPDESPWEPPVEKPSSNLKKLLTLAGLKGKEHVHLATS